MNGFKQSISLILFLLSLSPYAFAIKDRGHFLGANFSIHANAITQLKLPINHMEGSQLTTQEGMKIKFKNKGSINIKTLTEESLNIDGNILSQLPLYLMGIKNVPKNVPNEEVIKQKISANKKTYKPVKMASFRTPNGDGYLMIGPTDSVIYLTDRDNKSLITKIHIETMSESDINNILIKGLI